MPIHPPAEKKMLVDRSSRPAEREEKERGEKNGSKKKDQIKRTVRYREGWTS